MRQISPEKVNTNDWRPGDCTSVLVLLHLVSLEVFFISTDLKSGKKIDIYIIYVREFIRYIW